MPQLAREDGSAVIALDVGGSSVKSAVVSGCATEQPSTTPINSGGTAEEILSSLSQIVSRHLEWLENRPVQGVAFGFPGPFEYAAGISRIRGVAKFESIYGLDIALELRARLDRPALGMRFRNDAEAAIVGEAIHGVGRHHRRVLGITLGTGLGSAFLDDGTPVLEGPEVPPSGWLYPLAVGKNRADDVFSIRGLRAALEQENLFFEDIQSAAAAARCGDAAVSAVFDAYGRALGIFLQPWARHFGADLIVLQGGISGAYDCFGSALQAELSTRARVGALGSAAALLGAAELFAAAESTQAR